MGALRPVGRQALLGTPQTRDHGPLGNLDFVAAKETEVLLGRPGTGKTRLAASLAIRAC